MPPQYWSHFQNVDLVSNPTRLQRNDTCVEASERWMRDPNTYAAAAAKLSVDPVPVHDGYGMFWEEVT